MTVGKGSCHEQHRRTAARVGTRTTSHREGQPDKCQILSAHQLGFALDRPKGDFRTFLTCLLTSSHLLPPSQTRATATTPRARPLPAATSPLGKEPTSNYGTSIDQNAPRTHERAAACTKNVD